MANTHTIAVDLAKVFATPTPSQFEKPIRYLAFGDGIEVEEITEKHLRVRTRIFTELPDGSVKFEMGSGFIVPKRKSGIRPQDVVRPLDQNNVLRVEFVDVQQGDGAPPTWR
jgi:hypothetical protein